MEKAYDIKELVVKLKDAGLDLAEDAARKVVSVVPDWLVESAKLSATPIDDIAVSLIPHLKAKALEVIDKIDGKVGAA